MIENPVTLTIQNKRGLHARASAKFVKLASQFEADISVQKDDVSVGGTSIMGLLLLAAGKGDTIKVSATGIDAVDCLQAITQLVEGKFEEE